MLTVPAWRLLAAVVLVAALAGCGSSSRHGVPRPQPTTAPLAVTTTSTTLPGSQTSGPRTVLSPIGLRIRAQPSKSAGVLATAAQGTVLHVLSHTTQDGGWFQVKGATVTGWISDDPALSAPGNFADYNSNVAFAALYPVAWTVLPTPPATVTFRAPSGPESIMVTTAATVTPLGRGQPGYRQVRSEQVVVCGITSLLSTYSQTGTVTTANPPASGTSVQPLLAQVRLTLDAQHALGIDAKLTDPSQLQTVRDFLNSVTFPFPQCQR